MGDYRKMIERAKTEGVTNDAKMWKSIESVEMLLDCVDDDSVRSKFLRKQHEIMYGRHYDEQSARNEASQFYYTDRDGIKKHGAHWSCEDIENTTRQMSFPNEVTKWDKFVAMNAMYADTCRVLTDELILKVAHSFYFCDEDWMTTDTKVWDYFSAKEWYESREDD